jgi:hypothetical protein
MNDRADKKASDLLFERLPDRLFAPLGSINRKQYWALLCMLHARRFGPDAPMPPVHGFSTREIVHDIERELELQQIWELEAGEAPDTPINVRANMIFAYLCKCGWLKTERIGVEMRVAIRPAVSQFLNILVAFAETEPVFVSGKIRSIDVNLQQVLDQKADGDTLREAAGQARNLLEYVRNTGNNIHELMQSLHTEDTTASYVRRFFTDYIERVFIADYRELRTQEHPLSRRPQILRAVEILDTDPLHRERLISWYENKLCSGETARAVRLFERDLSRLYELQRIDEYLDRLDDEIRRANRRAFAYLEYRLRSLRPIDGIVRNAIASLQMEGMPAVGDPFPPGELVSATRLAEPRVKKERLPPTPLRKNVPSLRDLAYARVMRRAIEARTITTSKLTEFLVRTADSQDMTRSDDLELQSVTDFRCYQVLGTMALAKQVPTMKFVSGVSAMLRGYYLKLDESLEPNGTLIRGRTFLIQKYSVVKRRPSSSETAS